MGVSSSVMVAHFVKSLFLQALCSDQKISRYKVCNGKQLHIIYYLEHHVSS